MSDIIISEKCNQIQFPRDLHFIKYFLIIKGSKSKYTAISYERDIKDFFNVNSVEIITLDHIKKVNIFHVQDFLMKLQNKNLSSATINRKISSLSALYKWLMKYKDNYTDFQLIKYNPFGNVKEEKPTVNNKETEFLTKDECKKLLESIETITVLGLRNKAILSLAFTTALRKSEIINIKIGDIKKYGEFEVVEVTRKGNKKDIVKLQPKVLDLIKMYLIETSRDKDRNADEYLFIGHSTNNNNRNKLDASTLNYMIKKVCVNAGIKKKIKVHSTRHTAITLAITNGATIEKVREFAAHRNISTTNRYIHSIDKLKNNPGDNIDII